MFQESRWYSRRATIPHAFQHRILSAACLPIPPREHKQDIVAIPHALVFWRWVLAPFTHTSLLNGRGVRRSL